MTTTQIEAIRLEVIHQETEASGWSLSTRVAFRFCFIYLGLYCLSTQIVTAVIPVVEIPDPSAFWPIRPIVFWTAGHVFGVTNRLVYSGSGSGDKTFDWVLVFCLLVVAMVATAMWSVLDRERPNYIALHKWFRVFIRFCLAGQMITYGMIKLVPLQMRFPSLTRLLERYGDFSPMGVLWGSIGASPGYERFAGGAELLGGILLIFPRTTTLGALVCLVDMIQVFMLNMTYDVPVKLLSFHLILLSLFLLAPDMKRLANVFLLNRAAEAQEHPPLFAGRRTNRIALVAQIAFGIGLLGMNAYSASTSWAEYGGGRPLPPLYGIWDVEQYSVDGRDLAPLMTDTVRWRRVIFDDPTDAAFQSMDESFTWRDVTFDDGSKTLVLSERDLHWKATFRFDRSAQDRMTLDGIMDGHAVHVQLKLLDRNQFLLASRGFHWIQEYPYNR
jgi:uncharacterized membrane protein YphA (DoxX/SURF4 family)